MKSIVGRKCLQRVSIACLELCILSTSAAFAQNSSTPGPVPGSGANSYPKTTPTSLGAPQPGTQWSIEQIKQAVSPVRAGAKITPKWPNGAKLAVVISYDIDNESPLINHGNLLPTALSETEYGATTGLPRILALLEKDKLPATFYVPAVSTILAPDIIPSIQKSGRHEIALHGWIHESLPDLNNGPQEERLLNQAIDYFTKAAGKRPVGTRAGSWALSPYSVDIYKRSGMLYDSSMMGRDEPYYLTINGSNSSLLELPVSWIEDDAPYFSRTGALPSPELIFKVYRDEFDMAYREGTFLMLTFHPHISGRRSRIVHMEQLFDYMKSKPGVWFATAQEVAEYIQKNSPPSASK